jgi:hypothetical protein
MIHGYLRISGKTFFISAILYHLICWINEVPVKRLKNRFKIFSKA